jgi:hypothetical protein
MLNIFVAKITNEQFEEKLEIFIYIDIDLEKFIRFPLLDHNGQSNLKCPVNIQHILTKQKLFQYLKNKETPRKLLGNVIYTGCGNLVHNFIKLSNSIFDSNLQLGIVES